MRALDRLAGFKGQFGSEAARQTSALLEKLKRTRFRDPADLIRLHETVLFLRAYPQNARVLRLADDILCSFADRLTGVNHEPFEDPKVSGIAGTSLSTNFSYQIARGLSSRHGRSISIDWDSYEHSDRLGRTLSQLIPLAAEDWTVEAHPDWRRWFDLAHGKIGWLLERVNPEIYDLLEIPLRWDLNDSMASRSRTRIPRRDIFYHDGPFLARRDVSLEKEFASPHLLIQRVARPQKMLDAVIDTSSVRYRELWGFTHPDAAYVYHTDLGRGVDFFFWGLPREWRLPLRAYHCGMFFKNGVPTGYFEGLSLFERMEAGFNLYYTFREGETAWLYARLLKLFHEWLGVTCFSIDPYQLGHENEEALDSGAFWFYRKLGFRSASQEVMSLVEKEEARMIAEPGYRSSPAKLRRLAESPLIYGGGPEWDRFEVRHIGVKKLELPDRIVRAKQASEARRYLRLLQRDKNFRRQVLRLGTSGVSVW